MDVSQGAHKKASDDLFGKLPVLSLSKVQFVTSCKNVFKFMVLALLFSGCDKLK